MKYEWNMIGYAVRIEVSIESTSSFRDGIFLWHENMTEISAKHCILYNKNVHKLKKMYFKLSITGYSLTIVIIIINLNLR